jgi:hypothetical protein
MWKPPKEPCPFTLPLPADRLNWQLEVLGWSRQELARRLEVSSSKAAHWCQGVSFMPNRVAIWMETKAQVMLAHPAPLMWHRDPRIGAAKHVEQQQAFEDAYEGVRRTVEA